MEYIISKSIGSQKPTHIDQYHPHFVKPANILQNGGLQTASFIDYAKYRWHKQNFKANENNACSPSIANKIYKQQQN